MGIHTPGKKAAAKYQSSSPGTQRGVGFSINVALLGRYPSKFCYLKAGEGSGTLEGIPGQEFPASKINGGSSARLVWLRG